MPPRPFMMADRIQRLEAAFNAQAEELQELRLFCLDIHPDYSKRIIKTMQEMEQKVFHNVSTFEERLEDINKTVKQLVTQSANSCLELVNSAISSKMAGLDSRLIGLNKRHVEIDKELSSTLHRLNEFSDSVEKTLDEANHRALAALDEVLEDKIAAIMQKHLQKCSLNDAHKDSTRRYSADGAFAELGYNERGRSRESFQRSQDRLLIRARSISTDRELQLVISDARSLAATERA
jgi:hypothetical protein